ncbi:MAG: hypothetical protein IRF16MM_06465 [Candidatus Midichloria mitochondrii]
MKPFARLACFGSPCKLRSPRGGGRGHAFFVETRFSSILQVKEVHLLKMPISRKLSQIWARVLILALE